MKLFRKLKRNIKKITKWIFHPVRSTKNYGRKKYNQAARTFFKGAIIAYLVALVPTNYLSVGNEIKNFKPDNVIKAIQNSGVGNFLSGNLLSDIKDFKLPSINLGSFEEADLSNITNYYEVLGGSKANKSEFPYEGSISYSHLDELGRTRTVWGNLTSQMVEERKGVRHDPNADPSGYPDGKSVKNEEVEVTHPDGKVYHGWFYNRSHLIANQLGGSPDINNLITGTRSQNVGSGDGGMRYVEEKAVTFLENNPNVNLYYKVDPVYEGDELIPRYVLVDMLSEDGAINEQVKIYNVQNGYEINYHTGEFKKKGS